MSVTIQERSSETVTVEVEPPTPTVQHIVLTASDRNSEPRVRWTTDTVDNEFMGKKKSKCCCIYKKPRKWDEDSDSDSDSDCETGHCRGHVEKRKGPEEPGNQPGPSRAV